MSNRGLAITLFFVFLAVFIYEMETLKGSTSNALERISNNLPRQSSMSPQSNPNAGVQSALALVVANDLSYLSEVTTRVVSKLHPDLKDELRYTAFKFSVKNRRSTAGILKFDSLKLEFKDDFDKLRERYEAEHPGEKVD